ncbi:MAG: transposase [Bacteroidota bacterium]
MKKRKAKQIRLADHDYRQGAYFVTICCREKECYFGKVADEKIILSDIGKVAYDFWEEIPKHFDHVTLDDFVIMLNHVHGVLYLKPSHFSVDAPDPVRLRKNDPIHGSEENFLPNRFGPLIKRSLSSVISQYKGSVTRYVRRELDPDFAWQPRFYDRYICDATAIIAIRNYIRQNPQKWPCDEYNTHDAALVH